MKLFRMLSQPDSERVSRTQKTLALSMASVVNTMLSLLLSMAATRLLSKTEIAINSQTFLALNTVLPFLTLGIPSGIYYYFSKNEERKRAVANESALLVTMASVLFCLFIVVGGNRILANLFQNDNLTTTLYWTIPYILLYALSNVMTCVFVYENRLRFNAAFSVVQTFLTLVVVIAAMVVFRSGLSMVVARVAMGCLFSVCTIYLAYSLLPASNRLTGQMHWSSMKALMAVSIPLGISSLVGTLDKTLDQWIVSAMLTPETYAVYVQGAREIPLIGTITGAISTVLVVDLTKAAKNRDYGTAVQLFRTVAEKSSLVLMPVMVFFMAAARPFISFLYTEAYLDAVPVFQIYLLYLPIRVAQYSPLLIALGKSKFVLWKTVGGLAVNAVFSVLFVYLFGAEGAAVATILSLYLFNVPLNIYMIAKETKTSWRELLPFRSICIYLLYSLPGAFAIVIANCFLLRTLSPFLLLIIDCLLFMIITCPIYMWRLHLSPRKIWEQLWARLRP